MNTKITDISPKEQPKILTEFGMLIDSSREDFIQYLNNNNVGHVLSMQNLIATTYEEIKLLKEGLVQNLHDPYLTNEKREENRLSLEGVYTKMISMEEKFLLCKENIKERSTIL